MKKLLLLLPFLLCASMFVNSFAQQLPLVYNVENTGANYPIPYLPSFSELPVIQNLPDPFEWADGRGRIKYFSDWEYRRVEIGAQIQNYEIGEKPPRPDSITASYSSSDSTLTVSVTVNGHTLTLTSRVILPSGTGPFPAVIGMTFFPGSGGTGSLPSSIFTSRNIATIEFVHNQVTTYGSPSTSDPYYKLYPNLNPTNTGQYSAWAWGVSRLIDGLELVQSDLPIDLNHIAVTGCSYAGKMALFAGAFDERIALTIAQESGGGGATSWRYSQTETDGTVEKIDNTDYNWFMDAMKQFAGNNVYRMPEDHHELMAMCAPRALYVTANPDYTWLSNPSCYVASKACQQVYAALGISDRFGFSIVGGHQHCQVPSSQIPEIEAFVDKFLLGNNSTNTNVSDSPYNIDLAPWITWTNPTLTNGSSYFGKTTLISPSTNQTGVDTNVTFTWNSVSGAELYTIELSGDPTFTNITTSDSTTDTTKSFNNLMSGKKYYWRVQVKSADGYGPWSDISNFVTYIEAPAKPQSLTITPYSNRAGWFTFSWGKVDFADQYLLQTSDDQSFGTNLIAATTSDTSKILSGYSQGVEYYCRVRASNIGGDGPWSDVSTFPSATGIEAIQKIPTQYSISQNYPNPFNPTTKIKFGLPKSGLTKIVIYDLLGRIVRTLMDKELKAGYYEINVDATNLTSGIYFYRIQSRDFIQTKKMILMK